MDKMDLEEIIEQLEISSRYVDSVQKNLEHNETISEYFEKLFEDEDEFKYFNIANSVHSCNAVWSFNFHSQHNLYDLTHVYLCHSKFCANCQKMIQASRLRRFQAVLEETGKENDLYHIVLTAPNVQPEKLKNAKTVMFTAFSRFIRILNCTDKIRGIDLSGLGYVAAIRSLEVTYNRQRGDFHPHLHTIFAFRKDLHLPKILRNKFSYDYSSGVPVWERDFSELEVFLQKLWRAIYDSEYNSLYRFSWIAPNRTVPKALKSHAKLSGKKNAVTLPLIQSFKDGYSVIMNVVDTGSYVQIFKYAFKLCSDDNCIISYLEFRTLYFALKGAKTIQGYGKWAKLNIDDSIDKSVKEFYGVFIAFMQQIDPPTKVQLTVSEVDKKMQEKAAHFISCRNIQSYLNHLSETSETALANLTERKEELSRRLDQSEDKKENSKFTSLDFTGAYLRYYDHKRNHPLFWELEKADDSPKLTTEQLSVFESYFH